MSAGIKVEKITTDMENKVLSDIYSARGDNIPKPVVVEKKKRGRKPKATSEKKEMKKAIEPIHLDEYALAHKNTASEDVEEEVEDEELSASEDEIDVDELLDELKIQKDEIDEMSLRLRLVEDFLSTEFEMREKEYRDTKAKQFRQLAEEEEDKKEQELDKFLGTTPRIRPGKKKDH